jgi:hypothetical protein
MVTIHKYQKFNPTNFEAMILGIEDSKFYQEVLTKAKKDFPKGYQFISKNINPDKATGSNFFFVCLADEILGKDKKIANLDNWVDMLTGGNFAKGVYFDSNQLILYSDKATFEKNQYLINDLSKKLKGQIEYSPENPIIITGAKLKKSTAKDNQYGINLDIKDAEVKNAPEFASSNNKIKMGNVEKRLWTKSNGLSWLCLYESGLYSYIDNLASSNSYGRVAVLNAKGVLPEGYLQNLQKEKDAQIEAIEKRYAEAVNILKGQ